MSEGENRNVWQRLFQNLLDAPWTQILSTFVLLLSMYFISKVILNGEQLSIKNIESARGFITVLFGVGTIGIAVIVTLSGIFLTGENAKERFDRGKEVLTLILGIFGTIVGYYYGSESKPKIDQVQTTPLNKEPQTSAPSK